MTSLSQPDILRAQHRTHLWTFADPRQIRLTWREIDVLEQLLRDGAGNVQIANRMNLAPDTIKTHLRRAMCKTGSDSRTSLAVSVLRGETVIIDPRGARYDF